MQEDTWYQALRLQWKPEKVRLLLIAESPPDDGGDPSNRRFFYAGTLTARDNLYRGVIRALYDSDNLTKGDAKAPWLERLRDDGVFLIDLASEPINKLGNADRRNARRASVEDCVRRVIDLDPEGIVICHADTYKVLAGPLRTASLPLLHDSSIPFPLYDGTAKFVEKLRAAAAKLE